MEQNANVIAPPQNIAEVEQLVKRLYLPGPPYLITSINDQLQKIQLSSEGWQVADALLASDDPNVRFFAALTFTVKLNNDGSVFDPELSPCRLVSWLVRLVTKGESALVTKKLCSTLTTYYLRSPLLWKRPILHVAASMKHGDAIAESTLPEDSLVQDFLQGLGFNEIIALLWLCGTLADEVVRADVDTAAHADAHSQMDMIVADANALLAHTFSMPIKNDDHRIQAESLKAFLNWVNYAQPVWPRKPECLQYLRDLIPAAMQCLMEPELQVDALDAFRDILESYTSFFQPSHMDLLARFIAEQVQPIVLQCLEEMEPGVLPYGQIVIAFGNAHIQQIVEHPHGDNESATIIKLHFDMLRAPGFPGDEDELSIQSIEFWNTYIEHVNDTTFSKDSNEPDPEWLSYSKSVLTQLIELIWAKMWTPPSEIAKGWTDAECEGFREFRLDATDLMLSVYLCLGQAMLEQLVSFALRALEAKEWRPMEAALFCLNALADNVLEDDPSEEVLASLFSSSLFREVGDFSQRVPSQARRTAIDSLGAYGPYIEKHAEYLPDAVRFLFASLETGALASTAAKSIASLCSACRTNLTAELDGFLQQYQQFLTGPTSDPYTKEKVIGAIAAIVQALEPENRKVQPLLALVAKVEKDVQAAKDAAAAGDPGLAEVMGVTALNCLATIGKGLQVPGDVAINIYDDDERQPDKPDFWNGPEGQNVQQRIMGCFSVLQALSNNGDAIEAACQVLRSGFAESEPGPFVLPSSVTVSFLQQCTVQTPQVESVLGTACTLITQHSKPKGKRIGGEVAGICQQVASFIQQLGVPSNDPGVAQSCIEVLCRLAPYYSHILFDESSPLLAQLPTILDFTLAAIEGADPLPKRSGAEFWAALVKPPSVPMPDALRSRTSQVVDAYGPRLALILMRQVGGLAQRSDLDQLSEPLKALVTNQPAVKGWLEAALFSQDFPPVHEQVGESGKRRFLQQIVALRGDGRKTKEVVRHFYAACRGTIASY
ncbi:ARM repeat-containing protein [Teratosphaeria nubilosa]|uniref:ARM repeat-containing protein n=1 Tax=Teratosphaeria nubilosa TaxID=161662 RepID=A0A6G1L8A3_9PEZI|nr:ARM repeat-containing protein [Teratosphaeria nubilosa]